MIQISPMTLKRVLFNQWGYKARFQEVMDTWMVRRGRKVLQNYFEVVRVEGRRKGKTRGIIRVS